MYARILIVEDDQSIRETTAIGLRQAGFTVAEAVDGHSCSYLVFCSGEESQVVIAPVNHLTTKLSRLSANICT